MEWLNLMEKVVVVTGGSSGIGERIVMEFLKLGSKVGICDINNPDLLRLQEYDEKYIYVETDVSNYESVENAFRIIKEKFGRVDILINNAGINIPCLLIDEHGNNKYEFREFIYDKMMDVNVKGVCICSHIFGKEMLRNRYGVIINMSSECGVEGSEGQGIYAATKNAINSFTRSWSKELGRYGIRVVGVAPGILEETGLRTIGYEEALSYTRRLTLEQLRQSYDNTNTISIGRIGRLEDVANLVCFLSSDRAEYIHGVIVNISGGKTRG